MIPRHHCTADAPEDCRHCAPVHAVAEENAIFDDWTDDHAADGRAAQEVWGRWSA